MDVNLRKSFDRFKSVRASFEALLNEPLSYSLTLRELTDIWMFADQMNREIRKKLNMPQDITGIPPLKVVVRSLLEAWTELDKLEFENQIPLFFHTDSAQFIIADLSSVIGGQTVLNEYLNKISSNYSVS